MNVSAVRPPRSSPPCLGTEAAPAGDSTTRPGPWPDAGGPTHERPYDAGWVAAMSVRYDAKHKNWYFVIDLPRGIDGKRNQLFRRGFKTAKLAERAEEAAREQFGEASLSADGTVAAELLDWLEERELDLAKTTLSNYTNAVKAYINPHIGTRQLY